ncbi:MAG TPA: DUF3987 domain-containing protein [Pedococcus sp.]|nr:DUF3987 domain-containing protein [Pedococcus sp.]
MTPQDTPWRSAAAEPRASQSRDNLASELQHRAIALTREGFHVFPLDHPSWPRCQGAHQATPCDGKRGKHPMNAWTRNASVNPDDVARMFANGPCNIGIACGPSGLLVVDEDGARNLAVYADPLGLEVPSTRVCKTGRGAHLLFRHDHGAHPLGNSEGLLADFDINIRGAGGYIVGPGSHHENGTRYDFVNPQAPILPAPPWLLQAITTPRRRSATKQRAGALAADHSGPIPQGQRHPALLSYAGRLANTGLSAEELRPVFLERFKDCVQPPGAAPGTRYEDPACTEPFTEAEAFAILQDVLVRYGKDTLVLADPVEAWRGTVPTPLQARRERRAFPVEALPAHLATMVAAVAEFTQTDPAMAGTTSLAMLAAAAGGRVQLEVRRGWREPVNLFTVTVAAPGERKSAVQAVMSEPLHEAEEELADRVREQVRDASITKDVATKAAEVARAKAGKAATPEERKELMEEAIGAMQAADAIEVPTLPRLLADDITPERCAGVLAEQGGSLAVVSAEGGIFDIIAGRYSPGAPALDVWLKGHSGDQLRIDRQSRAPQFIPNPALTLCLMIQPNVLANIARNHYFRGRGLLARFLYAVPESLVGRRTVGAPEVPEEVHAAYRAAIKTLALTLADWRDPAVLRLSPQAGQMLDVLATELEPQLGPAGQLSHIADWGSKLVGAVARIAALVHLAESPAEGWRLPVEAASMAKAIRLGDYFKSQALYAFDEMRVDPAVADAEYLLGVLRGLNADKVSRRDLHAASSRSRFATTKDLQEPLRLLEEHGYLHPLPVPPTKGRGRPPSPTWLIHPVLATEDAQTTEAR